MKKMQTKRIIDIVMLIVLAALLFTVCMMFVPVKTTTARADEKPTKVELSFDPENVIPGKTIVVVVKISSKQVGERYSSASIRIVPMTSTSGTTNDSIVLDTAIAQYLSYDRANDPARFGGDNAATLKDKYDITMNDAALNNATSPYFNLGFAAKSTDLSAMWPSESEMIIEVPLKVSEDLADDTTLSSMTLGMRPNKSSKVVYGIGTTKIENYATDEIELVRATADIKIPSNDATLSELKMGIGDDLTAVDLTQNPITFSITGSKLDDFTILPTSNDGATIKVGLTLPASVEAPSGEKTKLAITTSTTAVYLDMTAEDGKTTKRYTISIKIAYVALSDLTVTSTPVTTGVTKNGLATEFKSDTLNYDVNVPEKANTTKVSATIVSGFDTNKSISLKAENCTAAKSSLTSGGTAVNIMSVKEGSVLKLTLTAPDGTTKVTYTLTFHKLSEDTGVDSIKVKGATTSKEYANNADKAKDENVDYYFILDSEPEEAPKGIFAITTAEAKATVKIGEAEYSETAQFEMGTYDVIVTAAAGNTKTYKVVLSAMLVLEFSENSNFMFIMEEEEFEDGDYYHYRRTYEQKGWVHGKDDKDLERYVIGGVLDSTTVRAFLANFATNQQNAIKLYDNNGDLITDGGNAASGITEDDLNDEGMYSIGTGWYIEFGTGETPIETVYISVLGDVDGDGYINASDKMEIMSYSNGLLELELEYRLAGYLENDGNISPVDGLDILSISNNLVSIDYYMNK